MNRSRLRRLLLATPVLIALGAVAPAALAQNASDQAVARTLFDEGARLYAAGSYAEACTKLEASYHLFAGIGTRGKLAECYEKVGRTASAWAMYREVVALAGKAGDEGRQRVATERAAALEPTLSHLTVVLSPASDAPGLAVKRGGEPVERGAMGTPVPVDPGTLSFEISAPGRITKTIDVKVAAGAATTFDVPALDAAPAPPPAPATTDANIAPASAEPAPAANTWQRPTGLVVAGVGVATAAVGGILALVAKSSYDSAFSGGHCDHASHTCDSTGQSQTDGARSQANIGGVLLGVGVALVAGGGVLFFTAPHAAPTTTGIHLIPELGPRTAGITLGGGF